MYAYLNTEQASRVDLLMDRLFTHYPHHIYRRATHEEIRDALAEATLYGSTPPESTRTIAATIHTHARPPISHDQSPTAIAQSGSR